jgi:hypothetical protein
LIKPKGEGSVIPFHASRAGLWAAQREWMQASGRSERLASRIVEVLAQAEHDLKAIEADLAT